MRKKKLIALLLCLMLFASFAAQAFAEKQTTEPVTIRIGVPIAPPALPILHMIEDQLLGENVNIELDIWNAPEQLIAMVQGGEHDMFAFPLIIAKMLQLQPFESAQSGKIRSGGENMNDTQAAVFSLAEENPPVPGCTISGKILRDAWAFSLAKGTERHQPGELPGPKAVVRFPGKYENNGQRKTRLLCRTVRSRTNRHACRDRS